MTTASDDEQLVAIQEVHEGCDNSGIDYWLFGGWAVDFHLGTVTREHADFDVAIWLSDRRTLETFLRGAGWRQSGAGEGYVEWDRGALHAEIAFLVRDEDGVVFTPVADGRADWPPDAFETDVGVIGDVRARVIALDALRAEKSAGYGGPETHAKDQADIAALGAARP
jgi:Aminoglycoside-2''-adenylyltransferase